MHKGKIYLLSNICWNNLKKIGVSNNTNKRIKTLQTSLPDDIQILYESEDLIDKYFYEYFLSKLLYKFRYRNDREFYDVQDEEIKDIFNCFNEINAIFNTAEKLNNYIIKCHPNYKKNNKPKNNK